MQLYRSRAEPFEALQFLGFEGNGREAEVFAGDQFESHLPSENAMVIRTTHGEGIVAAGDWLAKLSGKLLSFPDETFRRFFEAVA